MCSSLLLGKAEAEIEDETAALQYKHLREEVWSPFLKYALQNLDPLVESKDEPEEKGPKSNNSLGWAS